MPQPVTRSLDPWLYEPTLAALTQEESTKPDIFDKVIGNKPYTNSPSKSYYSTHEMINVGPMQVKGESSPIPYDTPAPSFTKTTTYTEYALGVSFTKAAISDQLYDVYNQAGIGIGEGYRTLKNLVATRLFANFYGTTYFTGPDGLAIGSASHTTTGGGPTRANILATSASLSYQSVQDLLVVGLRQVDSRGYPSPAWKNGDKIWVMVQPEDFPIATAIFDPMSIKEPGNNNNNPNVVTSNFRWEVISNPWLSTVGAGRYWFFIRDGDKTIYFIDREPLDTRSWTDPKTGSVDYIGDARFGLHVQKWSGYYGSGN